MAIAILTDKAIRDALTTECIGARVVALEETDSTNTQAFALGRAGAPEGTLVVAERQTAGRGRLGRTWHAPRGSSLLMSLLLRPELTGLQAQRATMICSLGAIEGIDGLTGVKAQVKWPNDLVMVHDQEQRKLGGVLTELGFVGSSLAFCVVGMGLNVNLDLALLPDVMTAPTSLLAETGEPVDRLALLARMCEAIEARYLAMKQGWSPHTEWRDHLSTLGREVRVGTTDEIIEGVALDVDADGALLVRTADGTVRTVLVGDVTLRGHRVDPAS